MATIAITQSRIKQHRWGFLLQKTKTCLLWVKQFASGGCSIFQFGGANRFVYTQCELFVEFKLAQNVPSTWGRIVGNIMKKSSLGCQQYRYLIGFCCPLISSVSVLLSFISIYSITSFPLSELAVKGACSWTNACSWMSDCSWKRSP